MIAEEAADIPSNQPGNSSHPALHSPHVSTPKLAESFVKSSPTPHYPSSDAPNILNTSHKPPSSSSGPRLSSDSSSGLLLPSFEPPSISLQKSSPSTPLVSTPLISYPHQTASTSPTPQTSLGLASISLLLSPSLSPLLLDLPISPSSLPSPSFTLSLSSPSSSGSFSSNLKTHSSSSHSLLRSSRSRKDVSPVAGRQGC